MVDILNNENSLSSVIVPVERGSEKFWHVIGRTIRDALPYVIVGALGAAVAILPIEVAYRVIETRVDWDEKALPFVTALRYGGEAIAAAFTGFIAIKNAYNNLFY